MILSKVYLLYSERASARVSMITASLAHLRCHFRLLAQSYPERLSGNAHRARLSDHIVRVGQTRSACDRALKSPNRMEHWALYCSSSRERLNSFSSAQAPLTYRQLAGYHSLAPESSPCVVVVGQCLCRVCCCCCCCCCQANKFKCLAQVTRPFAC